MKMLKKALSVVVASAMTISLAACGSGNAGSSDTFKIGGIGPTTGAGAAYGLGVKNATQLAVDEINAAGGINGYQIEFNFQDDELDAEKAVNAYNSLKDWNCQILLGCVTSGCCIAVTDKTKEDNMFQITPSGSAVECTQYENNFRVCFSDPNQGIASADYIADNKVAEKVAVIYESSNAYSAGIYDKFAAQAKVKNLNIVEVQSFTSDTKTDFSAQIQAIKSSGADLVFHPIYYSEAQLILTQAKAAGLNVKFFGCDGLDGILTIPNFDTSLCEGVMLLTPFAADATDKYTINFVTKYKGAYGVDTMNQFAADAYDAIYIIKAAIEKAGITADMDASAICDALKVAMTEIKVDGVTGEGITWTADGEPSKAPKAVIIENGAYKAL